MIDNQKPINSAKAFAAGDQPTSEKKSDGNRLNSNAKPIKSSSKAAPTSEKKIAANRRNAKNSTGPRTDAGKNRTRFNPLKDGLYAKQLCVLGESEEAMSERLQRLAEEFKPEGEVEWQQVILIAHTQQWIDRAIPAQSRRVSKLVKEEASYADSIANGASESTVSKGKIYADDIDAAVLRYFDEEPCKSLEKHLFRLTKRLDRLVRNLLELQQMRRKQEGLRP